MVASTNAELLVDEKVLNIKLSNMFKAGMGQMRTLPLHFAVFNTLLKMGIAVVHLRVTMRYLSDLYTDLSWCNVHVQNGYCI